MKLEEYRNQNFVGENTFLTPYFAGKPLPHLFHDTANGAFYITVDALNRMQSRATVGGNEYCIPAISLWFQATESYISTLYKIALEDSNAKNGPPVKHTEKMIEKFDEIARYFSKGSSTAPPLRNKLQEFATFRNILFHDLTMVKSPQYSHTLFAQEAEKLNEVDLFQSVVISVETFSYYRYIFKGIDLMPQIFINYQFDDLDRLANEILFPAFGELLAKKGVGTDLTLQISTDKFARESDVPITPVISYMGPTYPTIELCINNGKSSPI
ncbi:MAG: hypothetical protein ACRD5H_11510 [Nitrososphaerales archaeon]